MILKTLALSRVSNNYSSPLPTTAESFLYGQEQEKKNGQKMSAPIEILRILIPVHCSGIQTDLAECRGLGHERERNIPSSFQS